MYRRTAVGIVMHQSTRIASGAFGNGFCIGATARDGLVVPRRGRPQRRHASDVTGFLAFEIFA
jgi:hypothetical protein